MAIDNAQNSTYPYAGVKKTSAPYWQSQVAAPNSGDTVSGFQLPNLEGTVANQKAAGQSMLSGQDAQNADYLGRYTGAINNQEKMRAMYSRLGEEVGLPNLTRNANDLNASLEAIPETYGSATRGFDVNSNQLARLVGMKQSKLAPAAQKATTQAQQAQEYVNTQMSLGQAEQEKELQPYEQERQMLADRQARETTMFSTQNEQELNSLITKMNAGINLSEAEKGRAHELAMQEKNFQNEKELAKSSNNQRYVQMGSGGLYDTETGNLISGASSFGDWG